MGNKCGAHTVPTLRTETQILILLRSNDLKNKEDQLFYCQQRVKFRGSSELNS